MHSMNIWILIIPQTSFDKVCRLIQVTYRNELYLKIKFRAIGFDLIRLDS